MANAQERREQVSVPLKPELLRAVEQRAAADDRTVAGQIRHYIKNGLAAQQHEAAA